MKVAEQALGPLAGHAGTSLGGGRVLLVDDEPDLLRLYGHTLETAGFAVQTACDGEEALALEEHGAFDVIVSDITMPRMGGTDLLRAIRRRNLDVPVLLMTANPNVESAVGAVELGALRYLIKPIPTERLLEAVLDAARLHRLARLKREAVALVGEDLSQLGDRRSLEAAFSRALQSLWTAFQPIVSLSRRVPLAYEALVRSDDPVLPHPGALLGAAERLGRLNELGRAVRSRVADAVPHLPSELVFVNVHSHDLLDEDLYSPEAPLSAVATRVVLEITERAALDEVDDVEGRIKALRRLGYRLAVDDLGAGYAGLTGFTQIQPEVVKYDMSLVRGIGASAAKRRLVGSMTALFREWDLLVVAEGVETPDERDTLAALGCDLLQGYLFARPARGFAEPRW